MLSFAAPQFAWFLALPAGIVVLYLLRRKYLPRPVPSTFLWRVALKDHAANKPLQRLRKNLLLPVQFLAALALALALMQPYIAGQSASRTVLVFDLSASMQTVTGGKSRLETAADKAEEILRSLPPGEEITVLAAGEEVRQLISGSTDREDARKAVRSLSCGRAGADLDRAVSLAEAIRREDAERGARIIVFSDSYTPPEGVSAVNAAAGGDNRGVFALTAEEGSVYARICNYGDSCVITAVCEADGRLCEAKETEIPAGETAGVLFTIPEGTSVTTVRIRETDALAADNYAYAAVRRSPARTVALTGDNLFLENALQVRPDLRVIRMKEDDPAETEADLYIYGTSPLIFAADPSRTEITWGEEQEPAGTVTAEKSPMTEGLTLRGVTLRACRALTGGKAAVRAGGDVIAACTDREAVLGFSLRDTNLPLKYDFPILIQNILNMLLPSAEETAEVTDLPVPREESDTGSTAPDTDAGESASAASRGRELTGTLLAAFLILLTLEFVLAREPWLRRRGKEAGK